MKLTRGEDDANRAVDPGSEDLPEGLAGLRTIMDRLLADDGCPWDRAQTLTTLRPFLLEETCEVLDALDGPDPGAHREELGDLLFQIVFQSALREREGAFDLDGVIAGIRDKLLRRHPHVFGARTGEAPSVEDVERIWAEAKAREKPRRRGLDGVPRSLPALPRAAALQARAAKLGFDWPNVDGALAKLHEELDELQQARDAADPARIQEEFGDLLFVVVRIASKLGIDADATLAAANAKFERRFGQVLAACEADDIAPQDAGLERLEAMWQRAKRSESTPRAK